MNVIFHFTIDDFWAFTKHNVLKNDSFKRTRNSSLIVLISIIVLLCFFAFWIGGIKIWAVVVVFALIFGMEMNPKKAENKQLNIFKKDVYSNYKDEINLFGFQDYIFDESSIICKSVNSESILKWNGIKEIDETSEYFFIYIARSQAFIIPKRELKGNETDDLRVILKQHVLHYNTIIKNKKNK